LPTFFTEISQVPKVKDLRAYIVREDEGGADYHRQGKGALFSNFPVVSKLQY
jgi:hypothetical protein